jgi:hypothetical protein
MSQDWRAVADSSDGACALGGLPHAMQDFLNDIWVSDFGNDT